MRESVEAGMRQVDLDRLSRMNAIMTRGLNAARPAPGPRAIGAPRHH